MSFTVVLYSNANLRSRGVTAAAAAVVSGVSGVSVERSASEAQSVTNAVVYFFMALLLKCLRRRPSLEAVLKEDVDAVIRAAREAFVVGSPAQIVRADEEVRRRAYAVAEVERLIARARAGAEVSVNGVVRREAGAYGQVARELDVRLAPAAAPAYLAARSRVDSLPRAAAHVAHVPSPPALALKR